MFIKKILILSLGVSFAFANSSLTIEKIKEIKIGEDIPVEIKKEWKEYKEDSIISQYTKSIKNDRSAIIDTQKNKVVFKKYFEIKEGIIDPEILKINGQILNFSAKMKIKSSDNSEERVITLSEEVKNNKEAQIFYEQLIKSAKEQIKDNKEIKTELFISFIEGDLKLHKQVMSIFIAEDNVKSSLIYFEEKNTK